MSQRGIALSVLAAVVLAIGILQFVKPGTTAEAGSAVAGNRTAEQITPNPNQSAQTSVSATEPTVPDETATTATTFELSDNPQEMQIALRDIFEATVNGTQSTDAMPDIEVTVEDTSVALELKDANPDPVSVPEGAVQIRLKAPSELYVGLISLGFDQDTQRWQADVLNESKEVFRVGPMSGDKLLSDITMYSADGKTEYLCVLAASKKWDLASVLGDFSNGVIPKPMRGAKRNTKKFSVVVPYIVEVPETAAACARFDCLKQRSRGRIRASLLDQLLCFTTVTQFGRLASVTTVALNSYDEPETTLEKCEAIYNEAITALEADDTETATKLIDEITKLAKQDTKAWRQNYELGLAQFLRKLSQIPLADRNQVIDCDRLLSRMLAMSGRPPARTRLAESKAILAKHLGTDHEKVLATEFFIGFRMYLGRGARGPGSDPVQLMSTAVDELERSLGAHPVTHTLTSFMAELLVVKREPQMLKYATRLDRLATEMFGEDSLEVGAASVRKAAALHRSSQLALARKYAARAIRLLKGSNEWRPELGLAHLVLGQLLESQNDLEAALSEFLTAADLLTMRFEFEAMAMAAKIHSRLGQHEECLNLISKMRKATNDLRVEPEIAAGVMIVEARARASLGETDVASKLIDESLKRIKGTRNPQIVSYAMVAKVHTLIMEATPASLSEATALAAANLKATETRMPNHPHVAELRCELAECHELSGDLAAAFRTYANNHDSSLQLSRKLSASLSVAERYRYVSALQRSLGGLLSTASPSGEAIDLFGRVWNTKGLASRELRASIAVRRTRQGQKLHDELADLLEQKLTLLSPSEKATNDISEALKALTSIEEDLQRKVAGLAGAGHRIDSADSVAASIARLPDNTAVLELVRIEPTKGEGNGRRETSYDGFVIHNGSLTRVRLAANDTKRASAALEAWKATLSKDGRGMRRNKPPVARPLAGSLTDLSQALAPLLRQLPNASCLVISPDGFLHGVPWCALSMPEPTGKSPKLLLEKYESVEFCESTRDYVDALELKRISRSDAMLVVGDVNYAGNEEQLPETKKEIRTLQGLGFKTEVLSGDTANKSSLAEKVGDQRLLYFATHADVFPMGDSVMRRSPLLAAGIVLSGGKLLYGEEIAQWDLTNVKLAVLSACRGADGVIEWGDGIHSLQRAFKFAGTQQVVANQWGIDDDKAANFMNDFSEAISLGIQPAIALRNSQLKMLKAGEPATVWAGWRISR